MGTAHRDHRPYRMAAVSGLETLCTPMLVVRLFEEGAVMAEEALWLLGRLAQADTVSPRLLQAALAQIARRQGSG